MPRNAVIGTVVLALLAGLGAWHWDLAGVRGHARALLPAAPGKPFASAQRPAGRTDRAAAALGQSATPARAGARKCMSASSVSYTDGDCPPGSREQALTGGSLTVVAGAPIAGRAGGPAASAARLRSLALEPGEPTLRERQMDRLK